MEHKSYMMVVCRMGGSPPLYVASPKVDPLLDSQDGTMHVRDRCKGAVVDCWRNLGPIEPSKGSGDLGGRAT